MFAQPPGYCFALYSNIVETKLYVFQLSIRLYHTPLKALNLRGDAAVPPQYALCWPLDNPNVDLELH
jgi:hypothetical protein